MKKILNISFGLLAVLAVSVSCNKVSTDTPNGNTPVSDEGKIITIKATLSDALTKVSFDVNYGTGSTPTGISHKWQDGDILRISNGTDSKDFTLVDGFGTPSGTFQGEAIEGSSFTVTVVPQGTFDVDNEQDQAKDGDTAHLKYVASATNVTDLSNITLSESSSIIGIIAKLPENVAVTVDKLVIETSTDNFQTRNTLTVNLKAQEDIDSDDILKVYANVPTDWSIPANTKMLLKFGSKNDSHTVYTRYQEFPSGATIYQGEFNYLKLNCSHTDQYAGGDGSAADKAYLIGDKYQMQSMKDLMKAGDTRYFKLVDNIDMKDETWTRLNPNPYTAAIYLDGNGKKISNLNATLFDDLNGTVMNLTIEDAAVSGGSSTTGILANTIKTATSTVNNVDIKSSSVVATAYTGGLIGQIDNTAANTSVTNCDVSNTNVNGTLAGGLIGFANALVMVSGCTYTGGTVKATARYAGGLIASTSNYDSIISDCHVEDATLESSSDRAGGFAGLIHTNVQVKGCSVGTSSNRVTVTSTRTTATANVGGFVGVNYGKITKDGNDVRNKAFVTVTSSNTTTGNSMQIGGFAGYNTGTIEYSDANVNMTNLKGQYIGGFCGTLLQSGKIENCTETGTVSGNNYIGGFVGVIDSATTSITNCSSAGTVTGASSIGGFAGGCTANNKPGNFVGNSTSVTVTSSGSNFGGFIGNGAGTFTSNHATGDVASTGGGNGGGFAGGIWDGSTGSVFSKNYATGNVSGNANLGGFIGYIGGSMTMSDCYATGNVGNSTKRNQKYGGLVGFTSDDSSKITEGVTITGCYATGVIIPSFAGGGLIGRIGLATTSVSKCAAWNTSITPNNTGQSNWSSGAVVGVAFPKCTLTDNYRNPSMSLTAYWVPSDMTTFQHADVSSSHPLTDSTGAEMTDTATASGQTHYPQYPYHGKVEASKTLSQLASTTLGWSSEIWDFTGDLPTLR
jgi:hypothetical protein